MSKLVRAVFSEDNLKELVTNGKTESNGITFVLNGDAGWNSVGVSDYCIDELIVGDIATSNGLYGLKVEYILSDIGYDRIYPIISEYKSKKI